MLGRDFEAVELVQDGLGAVSCVMTAEVAEALAGTEAAALIAGGIAALLPHLAFGSNLVLADARARCSRSFRCGCWAAAGSRLLPIPPAPPWPERCWEPWLRCPRPGAPELGYARPARLDTTARSSAGWTGFGRWSWKPARRACMRSSARANAVSAAAGTRPPSSAGSWRTLRMRL